MASSSSIHQQQPDVVRSWVDLNPTIAGDEFASMPVSSNPNLTPHAFPSGDPDDQSGGPIVPARLPVMMPQTSQNDFDKFLDVSYKCGLPQVLVSGPCLTAFNQQLQEPFDWHTHKGDFNRFQRDSCVLSHIIYGMFGCWQPALELGLVYVVRTRLPHCLVLPLNMMNQ